MNSKLTKDEIKLLKSSLPDKRSGSLEILQKVGVRNKEMMTTNLEIFTSIYTELPDGIYDLTGEYLMTLLRLMITLKWQGMTMAKHIKSLSHKSNYCRGLQSSARRTRHAQCYARLKSRTVKPMPLTATNLCESV